LAVLEGGGATNAELVSVVRDGNEVIGEAALPGGQTLDFVAANVRNERTGPHAKVTMSLGGAVLAYSVFNIERDEDRTRLANSAAKRTGNVKKWAEPFKVRLDQFCAAVWPSWVKGDDGTWEAGRARKTTWLLEPWLLEGAGTILYGPPSTAKSWITMLWALGITHAVGPWPNGTHGPIMLVNLERPPELVRVRIRETARVLGAPERLLAVHARGRSLSDVTEAVRQTVKREGCSGVVVDSLSRSGTGDLTANDAANRAMDLLNGLDCAWCVIAHTPRSDSSHLFGSVMFEAAADLCVRVSSAESANTGDYSVGIKLETTKANDVRKGRPELWALDFGEDDTGLTGFRPARSGEFIDLEMGTMTVEDRIVEVLEDGPATAKEVAAELDLSIDTISKTCRRSQRMVKLPGPTGGRGRSAKWGLVVRVAEPEA
jgi:hypothetical protein